jgi:hypothetical protein
VTAGRFVPVDINGGLTEPSGTGAAVGALALYLAYLAWLAIAFVVRPLVLRARTGDAGFRRLSGRPGGPAWWGGVL